AVHDAASAAVTRTLGAAASAGAADAAGTVPTSAHSAAAHATAAASTALLARPLRENRSCTRYVVLPGRVGAPRHSHSGDGWTLTAPIGGALSPEMHSST